MKKTALSFILVLSAIPLTAQAQAQMIFNLNATTKPSLQIDAQLQKPSIRKPINRIPKLDACMLAEVYAQDLATAQNREKEISDALTDCVQHSNECSEGEYDMIASALLYYQEVTIPRIQAQLAAAQAACQASQEETAE